MTIFILNHIDMLSKQLNARWNNEKRGIKFRLYYILYDSYE